MTIVYQGSVRFATSDTALGPKTDKRSTIVIAPNRPHDPHYILRRIAKAITVSLETVPIMQILPELGIVEEEIDSRVSTGF